ALAQRQAVRLGHDGEEERQVDAVAPQEPGEGAAAVVAAHPHPAPPQLPQQRRVTAAVGAPADLRSGHPADGLGEDKGSLVRLDAADERHVPERSSWRWPRQEDGRGDGRLENVPALRGETWKLLLMDPPQ